MKPWLHEILACPIDKHYPLKLYIFSYESSSEDIESYTEIYENRDIDLIEDANVISISQAEGKLSIKDGLVLKETDLKDYLQQVLTSIKELNEFEDQSENEGAKKCLDVILSDVRDKIQQFSKVASPEKIDEILPELFLVNKYKIDSEIKSGILFCEECKRWFPIVDTIPQMLPDEFRNSKEELKFLKTNKNLLDPQFLNQELKPFNL